MTMRSEIKRWGNSAAVRIPRKLLNQAMLEVESPVTMKAEKNRIVIEALQENAHRRLKLPFSEAELLVGLNPEKAHADELPDSLMDQELGDW
jgi:antitoxin MazE